MPRKANGSTTPRSKKTSETAALQPTPIQTVPEVAKLEVVKPEVRENVVATVVAATKTSVQTTPANLDEEIRRRAYELYVQRNGKAGDPNRDWFIAEREVRARHATAGHSA